MIIGIPKEVKNRENRVGITPGGVKSLIQDGHEVYIEKDAGLGAGLGNELYEEQGAKFLNTKEEIWDISEMIMKVKEPIAIEYDLMKKNQVLFTYLHLAAEPTLAKVLLEKEVTAIAYETIELPDGSLPLLTPMSEVAGRMSVQVGAANLQKHRGGKGLLLGGIPGVRRGRVTIIGGGVVGTNAAKMAIGLGANVTILDVNPRRMAYLDDIFGTHVQTMMSNEDNIHKAIMNSDLVVGAVLVTGAKAPEIVTKDMIKEMEDFSVVVDVSIDQGGCMETIKPTTHDDPTYLVDNVIHYAVTNIPGDVPQTSTYGLTNVTLNYARKIAGKGYKAAISEDPWLAKGLNCYKGKVCHQAVAQALDLPFEPYA